MYPARIFAVLLTICLINLQLVPARICHRNRTALYTVIRQPYHKWALFAAEFAE